MGEKMSRTIKLSSLKNECSGSLLFVHPRLESVIFRDSRRTEVRLVHAVHPAVELPVREIADEIIPATSVVVPSFKTAID